MMKIKKQKEQKSVSKRKLKFQDYENCLETSQIENQTNYIRKKKTDVDSLVEDLKQFVNNKIRLRTQQRFKSERHNVNKIVLSSNDDKRMRSIDSIERYAYGTSKDLICMKEKIERNNIIKQYKNV